MPPKLFPTNPSDVMVIRNVTSNVITCSLPFARFGRLKFGGRGTLVKMNSGSIAVFSPVNLTPEVRDVVTSMGGNVRFIAALDLEHHIHLDAWKEAYPDARIIAPPGLQEKRKADPSYSDTPFDYVVQKGQHSITEEFDAEFDVEYVYGHQSRELVFLHKESRSLIEADLLFNLPAREQYSRAGESANSGLLTKMVIPLLSAQPPATWQKIFAYYILSTADRRGFAESMRYIDRWDFNRLIPCHGDVVESGGKGVFRTVMEWFLTNGKKSR